MSSRRELANAIRALSMDAVQAATCGHPGMPMGMADIAEVLWNDYLSHNPANPHWFDRDRFVLSNGHGSMLHYSLLHLSGYDLDIDELRNFRQLHSKTPGHPEVGETPGIETTTGPLGQGLANAVGMAIAEQVLADQFNRGKHTVIDHRTYVFLGDGCLMEGISHEVCSLAGTLGLGKLIAFYDDNGISIDGEVQGWFTDNTVDRFNAYGWHAVPDVDGHDPQAVAQAIEAAHAATDRPSIICCKTVIGWGAPNMQGTAATHGAALGEKEIAATREALGWEHPPFVVPDAVYDGWNAAEQGAARETAWNESFSAYAEDHPELAAELERRIEGRLPDGWAKHAAQVVKETADRGENLASRKASQNALNAYGSMLPELLGGSADLTGSNNTNQSESKALSRENRSGNYIYYGVREFGMSAIMNGIALHGGVRPYGGTFLVFSEYARNALRMAALMSIGNIFVYTHDSIGLGEDGPTHQAVEQTATLRLIPNMSVWRPCDAVESAVAWKSALERRDGPTCLLFTRQTVSHQPRSEAQLESIERGGYVLIESKGAPQAVLIATGSEVGLAVEAARQLVKQGCAVQVVSMPCTDRFDAQDSTYRDTVLPPGVPRVAVEAGVSDGWYKYVGTEGRVVGIDRFGASAPAKVLFEHFGFTADTVAVAVRSAVGGVSAPAA